MFWPSIQTLACVKRFELWPVDGKLFLPMRLTGEIRKYDVNTGTFTLFATEAGAVEYAIWGILIQLLSNIVPVDSFSKAENKPHRW
jgi:hypothetical protein